MKKLTPRFEGNCETQWLREDGRPDRWMMLLCDFAFIDYRGKRWLAPGGAVTDGASIPRIFWTIWGSPFDGDYRYAAVIHDRYCITKSEPSEEVHRMFYEACLAGGVGRIKARLMYFAVSRFGPRWETP